MRSTPLAIFAAILAATCAHAAIVGFDRPDMDVWMYPNGFDRGTCENAPIFGGDIGADGGDDRLAQYVIGWDTAASGIPFGLGPSSYAITRVTFRATHVNKEVFAYDRTFDGFQTYLPEQDPEFVPDADTGRPIELFGLGLRNGFTGLAFGAGSATTFGESTTGFGAGGGANSRHAFAVSASSPRADDDASDNISGRFDAIPFAVGRNASLKTGQLVPEDAEFTFELNLGEASVLAYFQHALDAGELGMTLSSLHPASFGGVPGAQVYPRFYAREYYDFVPEVVPQLEIEYTIIPETVGVAGHRHRNGAARLAAGMAEEKSLLMKKRGFTMIELLVSIAIVVVLASILYAAVVSARRTGAMAREVSASRQLVAAYPTAAAERGGELLIGYSAVDGAVDEKGVEVPNPACGRYPWRLAPYLNYQLRGTLLVNEQESLLAIKDRDDMVYRVSAGPSFGINATYVGGNYRTGLMPSAATTRKYGQFFASHLSHVTQPVRQIVFASSRFTGVTEPYTVEHGFHLIMPPRTTKIEWKGPFKESEPAQSFGYVDLRHNGKAVCVMLGGNVELLGESDLLDMRRWSSLAAEADDANYLLKPIQ